MISPTVKRSSITKREQYSASGSSRSYLPEEEQELIRRAQSGEAGNKELKEIRNKLVEEHGWGKSSANRLGRRTVSNG